MYGAHEQSTGDSSVSKSKDCKSKTSGAAHNRTALVFIGISIVFQRQKPSAGANLKPMELGWCSFPLGKPAPVDAKDSVRRNPF